MRVKLPDDEEPHGYRGLRGKAIWFRSAWTTKSEAVEERDKEKKRGKAASVFVGHRKGSGKQIYLVYSQF